MQLSRSRLILLPNPKYQKMLSARKNLLRLLKKRYVMINLTQLSLN